MKIEVVPHDPGWADAFQSESCHVAAALGTSAAAIHHIGSTAIPGIFAKPVIDILVEATSINAIDECGSAMESLGYEVMGEFGIPGRRYFRKDDQNGVRTHQVHVFGSGSPHLARHTAFRDFMIAHPEEALAYSDLKRRLAIEHPFDAEGYMDGKDPFIRAIDRRAAIWTKKR
jgi:GrpB-like predicted nucleotidyltransferase (UPF0157 family)